MNHIEQWQFARRPLPTTEPGLCITGILINTTNPKLRTRERVYTSIVRLFSLYPLRVQTKTGTVYTLGAPAEIAEHAVERALADERRDVARAQRKSDVVKGGAAAGRDSKAPRNFMEVKRG